MSNIQEPVMWLKQRVEKQGICLKVTYPFWKIIQSKRMKKTDLGKKGEELAERYLIKKGYQILQRNWRHNAKEIDIIAKGKDILVIVEVKSRNHQFHVEPRDAVTVQKQQFLIHAADAYIRTTDHDFETRFDVISIIFFPYHTCTC